MRPFYFLFCSLFLCVSAQAQWTQFGSTLVGESANNLHGNSCAISNDAQVLAVGAFRNSDNGSQSGQVRIYQNTGSDWAQIGADLNGLGSGDQFGRSVALSSSGDTVAIGAWDFSGGSGYVQTFVNSSGTWVQLGATISGTNFGDWCGTSVQLSNSGDTLAIGSPGNGTGHVRIFSLNSGVWTQIGGSITGDNVGDAFGYSVALSHQGNRVAIGAYGNDNNGSNAGHVKVFELSNGNWVQLGNTMDGEAAGDDSGSIMDCNADCSIVAIGAWRNDGNGSNSGHARVYQLQGINWNQLGSDIDGENQGDQFGNSITINASGNRIAVGANLNDGNGGSSGHVRVFDYSGGNWSQLGVDLDGTNAGDENGSSASLSASGNFLAMGSRYNDDNGTSSGHVRVFSYPTCETNSNISPIACDTYTSPSGNHVWTATGTYSDTIPNTAGCDSLITVNLTINSNSSIDVQTACDDYTWIDGITYTSSNNSAQWTLTNAAGCDSVVTLDLTINYSNTATDVQTACESYTWIDGNTYTSSNNSAQWTLTNAAGCDSIVTLDLTINYSNAATDVQTACESYTWVDGNTYTSSNNSAQWILTNSAGCDSVVTLDLTINYSNAATDVQTACESYTWIDGNTYTSSNNSAQWTLTNSAGCDSIVTLDLTINYSNAATDVQTACESYTWVDGNTYTSSNNSAQWIFTNSSGCDSIVTLDLTINSVDASITSNDPIIMANASNALYQWIDCLSGNEIIGATSQNFSPAVNGDYAVIVTENGCSDTSICTTISTIGINEITQKSEMVLFPNPTKGKFIIDLNSGLQKVQIYDLMGRIIEIPVDLKNGIVDGSNLTSGSYFIRVTALNGETLIREFVIER